MFSWNSYDLRTNGFTIQYITLLSPYASQPCLLICLYDPVLFVRASLFSFFPIPSHSVFFLISLAHSSLFSSYTSLSVFVCLCLWLSLPVSGCLYLSLTVSVCFSLALCLCLTLFLPVCIFLCPVSFLSPRSKHLSLLIRVSLSLWLYLSLSVCLPIPTNVTCHSSLPLCLPLPLTLRLSYSLSSFLAVLFILPTYVPSFISFPKGNGHKNLHPTKTSSQKPKLFHQNPNKSGENALRRTMVAGIARPSIHTLLHPTRLGVRISPQESDL